MKGQNLQEKLSIHHFHTPQVMFSLFSNTHLFCRTYYHHYISITYHYVGVKLNNGGSSYTCRTVQEKPVNNNSQEVKAGQIVTPCKTLRDKTYLFLVRLVCIESPVTQYVFLVLIPGFHEGMLWKKGKENTQFLKRKFVLSEREFTLTYYNKENVSFLQR